MALFDIFKRKPAKSPQKRAIRRARQTAKLLAGKPKKEEKPAPSPAAPAPSKPKKISGQAYQILKKPHVTEKATDLSSKNQYVFEVTSASGKTEIKKALEDTYGVDVVAVRVVNIPRKKRRLGRIEGWRKGYKKAIVKIKAGQKIEVLPR